jgi:hypothetical protein
MTPKRTTPSKIQPRQKYKPTSKKKRRHTMLIHSKETQNQSQVNDTQGTQTLPEQQNADRKRTSISAFKKWQTGT